MPWPSTSLNRKLAAGTAAGLLVSSLVFLALFLRLYGAQLEQERSGAATQVTRLLRTSLENAMLKRDLDGLRAIVERLGHQPDILGVMITNPAGTVRFANDPTRLDQTIPADLREGILPSTEFQHDPEGREVLRSINPVPNQPPCQECHGPMETKPVNGILYVDYDAAPIRRHARNTTLLLMGSGSLIVLINLAGGWWFMRRYVLKPVARLSEASCRLSSGDLAARVNRGGEDELGRLADTFNHMASSLEAKVRALGEKEQFLRELVDAIPDGVRIIDSEYRVILANEAYRNQLGLASDHDLGGLCHRQSHGRDAPCPAALMTCPVQEIARNRTALRVVHRHLRVDGHNLDVEIYAAPMNITRNGVPQCLVVESIRDLEQEVKFSHEQKLSELGRLAAGVAHEIHNPLASVRMALHAALQASQASPPDTARIAGNLDLVDHEIDSCIEVTERLLKLSVPPPAHAELVVVDDVVDETLKLLRWEAQTRSVHIELEVQDGALRVLASDSELRMLTLNLAQNALHAMLQGGLLQVTCARVGPSIELVFSDTGVGIYPDDLKHIFEPFFSRRADGVRGTGLGLPITKAIVESRGGSMSVDSTPGQGSRFTVRFPDADQDPEG